VIRTFRPGDEHALRDIHLASITRVGPLAYNAAQIAAWATKTREPAEWLEWHRYGDRITIAFTAHGEAAAFTLLEADGHLDMLYCHPDHVRQGHALSLVEEASAFGRSAGLSMITTDASELARPVFLAAGYTVESRQDFLLDGVPIHNYAMCKDLIPQDQLVGR
jgi:putative acetyltransferase